MKLVKVAGVIELSELDQNLLVCSGPVGSRSRLIPQHLTQSPAHDVCTNIDWTT